MEKWRQNKGRKGTNPKIKTKEDKNPLDDKLKRVELEVTKYKEARDKKKQEEENRRQENLEEDDDIKKLRIIATK